MKSEANCIGKSVLAFGNYEEVVDRKERDSICADLLKELPMLTPVESAAAEDVNAPEMIVFRIRVDRITGVSEGVASDEFLLTEDAADGFYTAG
jgi:nitroimidazol reductase NimA-like FMN-containing flavoprotein (pyridoxamine 5'-phosphate oxidase superfamily)